MRACAAGGGVGVGVAVGFSVGVAVGVAVDVGVAVGVAVDVGVGVGVGVSGGGKVGVAVGVAVVVAVAVGVAVAVAVAVAVGVAVAVAVAVAVGVGIGASVMILKFVFEISKKMFPTASTFIRAVVVSMSGIRTDSAPSLGVLAARMVGKVLPPSVEREILTFAALTGAAVVPLTFQVTLKLVSLWTLMLVLGAVTANGPEPPSTVTTATVVLIPPALARLSRATTWNVMAREIAGRSSPVNNPPVVAGGTLALFKMNCKEGNVRVPPRVGR